MTPLLGALTLSFMVATMATFAVCWWLRRIAQSIAALNQTLKEELPSLITMPDLDIKRGMDALDYQIAPALTILADKVKLND